MKDFGLIAPGNWFMWKQFPYGKESPYWRPRQVTWGDGLSWATYSDRWKPIPLTPDLLRRLGFEKTHHEKWELGECRIRCYKAESFWVTIQRSGRVEFKYLHTLQNLYHIWLGAPLPVTAEILEGGTND